MNSIESSWKPFIGDIEAMPVTAPTKASYKSIVKLFIKLGISYSMVMDNEVGVLETILEDDTVKLSRKNSMFTILRKVFPQS